MIKNIAIVGGILIGSELCRRAMNDPESIDYDPAVRAVLTAGAVPAELAWMLYEKVLTPFVYNVEAKRQQAKAAKSTTNAEAVG